MLCHGSCCGAAATALFRVCAASASLQPFPCSLCSNHHLQSFGCLCVITRAGGKQEVALEPLSRLDVHVVSRRLLHPAKGLSDPRGITTENISQVRAHTCGCMHVHVRLRMAAAGEVRTVLGDAPTCAAVLGRDLAQQ
jgi:hypothetical protein